jgi:hypothetical protein
MKYRHALKFAFESSVNIARALLCRRIKQLVTLRRCMLQPAAAQAGEE